MSILLDTNGSTITNSQKQLLESYLLLPVPDRLSFYLKLYEFTGNTAALDMAEICSSSGLRGGIAWTINEAYSGLVPGYPPGGASVARNPR